MAPHTVDPPFNPEVVNVADNNNLKDRNEDSSVQSRGKYALKIFSSSLNILAYILIGATVGISLLYSFLNGLPLNATPMHIVLCVIGYQLLMAVAILNLSPSDGLSSVLTLRDKRRAHTVLQIVGSSLAIIGNFVMILHKQSHWNTLHGIYGLVALVFTVASLINGLASLYAYEWRRWLPGNLSKITHICFGTVAFVTASVSLCYGFDKNRFRTWATDAYVTALIAFTGTFTVIVIINPIITFFTKCLWIVKK